MLRTLVFAVALLVPSGALATSVQLDVFHGSGGGFGWSTVHTADGCELNGYWRCGSKRLSITPGPLYADFDGVSAFDNIHGYLIIDGVKRAVGGYLDFASTNGTIGELKVDGFGVFRFADDRHGTKLANTYDAGNGTIYLWGQNFGPSKTPVKGGFGIDLGMNVTPIPEPSAALVFGLGALLVGAARRR